MAEQIIARSKQYGTFHEENFGGMVRNISPFQVKAGDLKLILNWNCDTEIGALNVRPGYATFLDNPDSQPVQALIPFIDKTDTLTLFRVSGTSIYKWTSGPTWGSSVKTVAGNTNTIYDDTGVTYNDPNMIYDGTVIGGLRMSYVSYYNKLFFANGADPLFYYDPDTTTFTTVTTGVVPTDCKFLEVFQNRVFVAGTYEAPSRLYFSRVYDGTDWTIDPTDASAASSIDVDPEFGGSIVGIKNVNNRLDIYKEHGMYRWDGITLVRVPTNESATSSYSISDIEGLNYFTNRDSMFSYDGTQPSDIGFPNNDIIKGISGTVFSDLQSASFDFRYYLAVGNITDQDGNSYTNAVIVYDRRLNHFYLYSFYDNPYCWGVWVDPTTLENNLYFGDNTGQVYIFDDEATSDNGHAIHARIETHLNHFGYPEMTKDYAWLYPFFKQGMGTKIFYSLDEDQYRILDELHAPYKKMLFPARARSAKNISLAIDWSGTTDAPLFRGFTLNVEPSTARSAVKRGAGKARGR